MPRKIFSVVLSAWMLASLPAQAALQEPLAKPYAAPEFSGIQTWLNSKPLTLADLKGKVVLIDFWTYSCINCIRTLPHITQWDKDYRDKGLVIIGVHAPEFRFEKDTANIQNAITKYGIAYPVAIDNNMDTWNAFENRYWPAHYLIDKQGNVVYTHFGEGNYAQTENNIRYLLGLDKKADTAPDAVVSTRGQTPETYLGTERSEHFASPEKPGAAAFSIPDALPLHHWALSGKWKLAGEHITAQETGAKLQLHFNAGKVFLVMGTQNKKPVTVHVALNGAPVKDIVVDKHMLYELVSQDAVAEGTLEITSQSAGLEAYAFTFGK